MHIIPAIDIIEGKCVRLTKGDYAQKKIYNEDPVEVAKQFEGAGLQRLHLVDLDGAKAKKVVNWKVLEKIATRTGLLIDFGGGLRTNADLDIAFNSGAKQITAGSIAITDKPLVLDWLKTYGAEKIILGADARKEKIAIHGWGETAGISIFDHLHEYVEAGIRYSISTDIDLDGAMKGPSFSLYKKIKEEVPTLLLIASGGVTTMKDVEQLAVDGLYGAIIGKAIYENTISLADLGRFVLQNPPITTQH